MIVDPYILVPLYLYPSASAWKPLHNQITKYPGVNFQVIINPDSGPEYYPPDYPASNWATQLEFLNEKSNVQTLGYVYTDYATRAIEDVYTDIDAYYYWSSYGEGSLGVDGIFFDEAPYADDDTLIAYMTNVTDYARASNFSLTTLNPGCSTASAYYDIASAIVAVEDTYAAYEESRPDNVLSDAVKSQSAFVINSFTGTVAQQKTLVNTLLNNAVSGLYISTYDDYGEFSSKWANFVTQVAAWQ